LRYFVLARRLNDLKWCLRKNQKSRKCRNEGAEVIDVFLLSFILITKIIFEKSELFFGI